MAKILCEVRYNNYNTATNSTCFRAFFTKKSSCFWETSPLTIPTPVGYNQGKRSTPKGRSLLNAQLKTGRFEGDVKVKGIKPHPEENITITVMTDYRNGERLQELIKMITDHIGRVYPSTNINVNANGCWTKVAVVVQSNEKGTYLAVAIQLKNLAYPQN